MNEIVKDQYLENHPKPISLKTIERRVDQMKKNVCKIYLFNGIKGTGFFCKIPYNNKYLLVLITNNHIINEKIIEKEEKILISINKKKKEIELKDRINYRNKEYDITIIEIKNKDEINNYLELDENIIDNISNMNYIKESIYIIQYEGKEEEIWNIKKYK